MGNQKDWSLHTKSVGTSLESHEEEATGLFLAIEQRQGKKRIATDAGRKCKKKQKKLGVRKNCWALGKNFENGATKAKECQ